jgi:hypothetical protein
MKPLTLLAATALLALAGCDRIPFLQGDQVEANGAATNAAAGNASANVAPGDAGITSSRSLAGLSGNTGEGAPGGKDPIAVQAGSPQGRVDPRLVGRWTDNGDCKVAAELRPDGVFVAPNGAEGRWEVAGSDLVFRGAGGEFRLRLDEVEPDRIVTTNQQGQTGGSTRC